MGGGMGTQGSLMNAPEDPTHGRVLLAQNMPGSDGKAGGMAGPRPRLPETGPISDVPMGGMSVGGMSNGMPSDGMPMTPMAGADSAGLVSNGGKLYVPLGQLADIQIVGGPPMVRDEDGMLVGYVYVDIDQDKRDIGGYVDEAKAVVAKAKERGELAMPDGYFLKWTGQYELLEEMAARMKIVIPVTLMLIFVLLFLQFKNIVEVLIILLSIPFALVGSVWLLWLLDFRLSTAVYVGVIALVGLAAQTGIIMIVYIDHAYERRKRAGKMRDLQDVIHAHMEGTVMRVRPKLMTVGTMLIGLIPLLWATGSGADVMKRLAAPMVGGLITSAFLTLEIIPVISTYWRREQLLWERLVELDPKRLLEMKIARAVLSVGWVMKAALWISTIYVTIPATWFNIALTVAGLAIAGGTAAYFRLRPGARQQVWPDRPLVTEGSSP
jgi:Cu(I)/Ag(I) efflux system membrane protein CusA/SilA